MLGGGCGKFNEASGRLYECMHGQLAGLAPWQHVCYICRLCKHRNKRITGTSNVRLTLAVVPLLTRERIHKVRVSNGCRVAAVSVYHFLDAVTSCDRIRRQRPILGSISTELCGSIASPSLVNPVPRPHIESCNVDSYAIVSTDHDEQLGETFGGRVADLSLPSRAGGEGKNHEIQR